MEELNDLEYMVYDFIVSLQPTHVLLVQTFVDEEPLNDIVHAVDKLINLDLVERQGDRYVGVK